MSLRKKNYDVTYKVLVLGESTVGKTALIKCYTESDKEFDPNLVPTIGKNSSVINGKQHCCLGQVKVTVYLTT